MILKDFVGPNPTRVLLRYRREQTGFDGAYLATLHQNQWVKSGRCPSIENLNDD